MGEEEAKRELDYTADDIIAMAMADEEIDPDPEKRAMAVMGVVFSLGM